LIPHASDLAMLGSMIVLNFHCIGKPDREFDNGEGDVCVDPDQFVEILDTVDGRQDVRLTFDDGNRSDVTRVLPELTRRGLKAHFFICPSRFGTPGFVDVDDLRELSAAGMSLGSHGMDHVRWRKLGQEDIDREIVLAKQVLEDALGAPVETAACPFGAYDRRTLRALREAGFKRVYTSDGGRASSTDWLVARNTVRRSDSADTIHEILNGNGSKTASLTAGAKRWLKQWR
jgi:peptidoglycan/xylan/chitin deacetylase (PgdA/CDA1 family)